MKKITLLSNFLICLSIVLQAQITSPRTITVTKKIDTTRPVMLKIGAENSIIDKLPDLKIVSLTVSYLPGSGIEINYTLKNEGTAPVAKGSVGLSGLIGFGANDTRPFAGCASTLGLSYQYLNPGESESGSYRCSNVNRSPNLFYSLTIDISNKVKELNENNNTAQVTIL